MADVIDEANEIADKLIERSIQNKRPEPPKESNGVCLWCNKPDLEAPRRFCDKYCAADWERENNRR